MMRYGYFDSEITGIDAEGMPIFDRAETSELFRLLFAKLLTNGVLAKPSDCFQVLAGENGLTVKVRPGFGMINGAFAYDAVESTYALEAAPAQNSRIDRMVLRCNYLERLCEIVVKTGTAATNPVPPALLQPVSGDYYELGLALVTVGANKTMLTQSAITDTRADSSVCGFVTQFIDSIDTEVFFAQFNAFYREFTEKSNASYAEFERMAQAAYNGYTTAIDSYIAALEEQGNASLTKITEDLKEFQEKSQNEITTWFEGVQGLLEGDVAVKLASDVEVLKSGKQDKISGVQGQIVGFDEDGTAVAQAPPDTGVTSFKGRKGAVTPRAGDYTAADVGAHPSSWMPTAADVGAVPIARKVNGKALSADVFLSAADVGAVPTTRTVNGKALSANVSLSAADVGAVPTTRTVNGKALSSNVSLSAADVGALAATGGTVDGSINVTGNLTLKGSGNYGNKINLGDGDYVHISEPTDDCMEIKARKVNFLISSADADCVAINGKPLVGKSLAGKSVQPENGTTVTAGEGAEIFNDYRIRTLNSVGGTEQGNVASGSYSHAEGTRTTASGNYSHAEGKQTGASGECSHAEGTSCAASGEYSHAEGLVTRAIGTGSHAEGNRTTASGDYSHAEGSGNAKGIECHAEGMGYALGNYSHAEGESRAEGRSSHAEGIFAKAIGDFSHAGGYETTASAEAQTVVGKCNVLNTNTSSRLIVGKGTSDTARANCLRVTDTGVYASGSYNASGADYAEFFEWLDGNPEKADRVGLFVTLESEKIRLAQPDDDFILGIVSAEPSVCGDVYDDQWKGMYLYDIYGRPLWEDVEVPDETIEVPDPEQPDRTITRVIIPAHTEHRQKLNPDYDNTQPYVTRSERPEWDAVGMLGKLVMRDDGTCRVNECCAVGENGTATYSGARTKYRVMARLDESHIRVLIL